MISRRNIGDKLCSYNGPNNLLPSGVKSSNKAVYFKEHVQGGIVDIRNRFRHNKTVEHCPSSAWRDARCACSAENTHRTTWLQLVTSSSPEHAAAIG